MDAGRDLPGQSFPPPSASRRRAVIDVGTNSVKVLVADITSQGIAPVWEQSEQTRLGRGLYDTGRMQPESIAHTAQAAAEFTTKAKKLGAGLPRVIATSATRDAVNRADLLSALAASAGVTVEVISGDQEAEWAFRGVLSDPARATGPLLILDVGGGSTEFVLGDVSGLRFRQSFPLGVVRLHEQAPPADPPTHAELAACRAKIQSLLADKVASVLGPALAVLPGGRPNLVGTGGPATILARVAGVMIDFDRERIESIRLDRPAVEEMMARFWRLPLAERKQITGLPANRADVMLFGVAIYAGILEQFGFSEMTVSTRGLRFGALLDFP
ncbi:MAG TPA: Ppx/GppA phosphatase family protein [Verrucomicrobiae bacterium]|nr:Ppx/GppA phosphatase family protein [Verrucomicrobiae bacterium]